MKETCAAEAGALRAAVLWAAARHYNISRGIPPWSRTLAPSTA